MPPPAEIILDPGEKISDDFWSKLTGQSGNPILVFWLGMEDLSRLDRPGESIPSMIIGSSTVVGKTSPCCLRD